MLLAEYRHKRTIRYYSVNIKICWPPFYIYHHVVGPPHIRLHSLCILQGSGRGEFHTGAMWQLIDPIIKCNYPKTGKGAKVSKEQAQAKRRRQTKKKPDEKPYDWLVFHSRVEKTFHHSKRNFVSPRGHVISSICN